MRSQQDPVIWGGERMMARICLVLMILVAPATAAQLHLSPKGVDENVGTAAKPFKTIGRAQAEARKQIAAGLGEDLHIVFARGTYHLSQTLRFDPRDSGTAKHHVIYRAAKGAKVLISGGVVVHNWVKLENGLWAAKLPTRRTGDDESSLRPREMFVGDKRRLRARFPNSGYLRVEKVGEDRRTKFVYRIDDLKKQDVVNGELIFLHDWSMSRISIRSVDTAARRITLAAPAGCAAKHYAMDHFEKQPRFAIEGLPSLIDLPGDWAIDSKTKRILYKPLVTEVIGEFAPIVPVLRRLMEVRGDFENQKPVLNLHFQDLSFAHCAWQPPAGGYASGQSTVHEKRDGTKDAARRIMIDSAIVWDGVTHCSIVGGRITHLGGNGLWVRGQCHYVLVGTTTFTDISGNGLMIGEEADRGPEKTTSDISVVASTIENCGAQYFGAVGIWVGITQRTRIIHNEIHRLPYTGISLGWRWNPGKTSAGGQIISHNHIHHVMQTLSDGGGIYTLGNQPDSLLSDNHIHDIPTNAGRAESNGMFLDQGSTGFTIRGNLIYSIAKSPLRFHQAMRNTVEKNQWMLAKERPEIRYNNTKAERITSYDNKVLNASELKVAIEAMQKKVGPKAKP